MANPDYEKINEMIDQAKDLARSFEREVSKTISNAVNDALGTAMGSGRPSSQSVYRPKTASSADIRLKQQQKAREQQAKAKKAKEAAYTPVKNPQAKDYERKNMGIKSAYSNSKWRPPQLYKNTGSEKAGGVVKTILGYGLAAAGAALLVTAAVAVIGGGFSMGPMFSLLGGGVMVAAGLPIGVSGSKQLSRIDRFKKYVKTLGNKTVIALKNLAQTTGKSIAFLRNDLQDMAERRYFTQGHFDEEKEQFMTSDETYQNYLVLLEEKKKVQEVQDQADNLLREAGLSQTGIEIIRTGQEYLEKIQRMNSELPGIEITEKLQALEQVISRILTEIRNQPAKATELRRMMNYYLPTVWNLLQTYKQIEDEPVKTAKMLETKAEIEKTIDMVTAAFENLLDKLFLNRSWDVSADISVLNTMLKQDSLKDEHIITTYNEEG